MDLGDQGGQQPDDARSQHPPSRSVLSSRATSGVILAGSTSLGRDACRAGRKNASIELSAAATTTRPTRCSWPMKYRIGTVATTPARMTSTERANPSPSRLSATAPAKRLTTRKGTVSARLTTATAAAEPVSCTVNQTTRHAVEPVPGHRRDLAQPQKPQGALPQQRQKVHEGRLGASRAEASVESVRRSCPPTLVTEVEEPTIRRSQRCRTCAGTGIGSHCWMSWFGPDGDVAVVLGTDRISGVIFGRYSHPALALFAGGNVGVFSRVYQAHLITQSGDVETAVTRSDEAILRAREMADPFTFAIALDYTAMLNVYRFECGLVLERAEETSAICAKHNFAYYGAMAEILAGWATEMESAQFVRHASTSRRT